MIGIDVILAALGAGVSAGVTSTAGAAVTDLYTALRDRIFRRAAVEGELGEDEVGEVLEGYQTAPGEWETRLTAMLERSDAAADPEVLAAARALLARTDPGGSTAGKYTVDASQAKGVQIGDQNTQTNTFN